MGIDDLLWRTIKNFPDIDVEKARKFLMAFPKADPVVVSLACEDELLYKDFFNKNLTEEKRWWLMERMLIEEYRIHKTGQLHLFPQTPNDVCQGIGLNFLAAKQLYNHGFLSFDPEIKNSLDDEEKAELIFLGSLVVAGCSEYMIKNLIQGLKYPYHYNINLIYYNWPSRQWKILPRENDKEITFRLWLNELVAERKLHTLNIIMKWTIKAIEEIETK